MMRHEDTLTSLTLSKNLKVLDVRQDSQYRWVCYEGGCGARWKVEPVEDFHTQMRWCAAYSALELFNIFTTKAKDEVQISWFGGLWRVTHKQLRLFGSEQLADALANLLIYLTSHKMIELDKDAG